MDHKLDELLTRLENANFIGGHYVADSDHVMADKEADKAIKARQAIHEYIAEKYGDD